MAKVLTWVELLLLLLLLMSPEEGLPLFRVADSNPCGAP